MSDNERVDNEEETVQVHGTIVCGCGSSLWMAGIRVEGGHDHIVALKCNGCGEAMVSEDGSFMCMGPTEEHRTLAIN